MYVPMAQRAAFSPVVLMTINAAPGQRAAVERDVAAALARTEPGVTFTFRTFDQFVDATVTQERLIAMLSGFFGGLALLLAAIGLYGVVAQAMRTRRSEIGLRMALGAHRADIMRLMFRRVGVLIASGLALGLASSLWAARFVTPLLFQVEARDPSTFVQAAAVLCRESARRVAPRETRRPAGSGNGAARGIGTSASLRRYIATSLRRCVAARQHVGVRSR